jgi:hypothetical protein
MDLKEIGGVNWTDLVLDKSKWRVGVKRVTEIWVP